MYSLVQQVCVSSGFLLLCKPFCIFDIGIISVSLTGKNEAKVYAQWFYL